MEEAAAAAEVLNAHSRALHGTDDTTVAELDECWRAPELEFPADVFVAERDGVLIGYADVIAFGDTAWVDVRATDAAAYDSLHDAANSRAQHYAKPHTRGFAAEQDSAAHDALERAGYKAFRHGFRMRIELDGELLEPRWPPGFTVRAFQDGDGPLFHRGHQESFADTWGFTPEPFENWAHWFMGTAFQPEHWFVVETGGELAAVAICLISETEEATGWVRILGVLPEHRRQGLALALLQHVFRHFTAVGMKAVGLGVDAENPTGAVALYERAGMHVVRRNVTYERLPG